MAVLSKGLKSSLQLILVLVLLGGVLYYQNNREKTPTLEFSTTSAPNPDVPQEAMDAYDHGRGAVYEKDFLRAKGFFEKAIEIKPDFTEAWYNLGLTQVQMAIDTAHLSDDQGAIDLFQNAIVSKRKSKDLMNEGKWFVYNEQQQEKAKKEVEMAIRESDDFMDDQNTIITALKVKAQPK